MITRSSQGRAVSFQEDRSIEPEACLEHQRQEEQGQAARHVSLDQEVRESNDVDVGCEGFEYEERSE